jgi:ubiquinone/menaquinone biosynthesis C-methylase UbiE
MNAEELAANHSLTEWVVRDLNAQPVLPYADQSMDVVLCQLSMDYLTQPVQVCREITRVLRPGGQVHILFSNRLFLSKAVAVWTGADDVDHAYLLGQYLHAAGALTDIAAADLSQRRRDGKIVGDPLYVVTAVRR